jgi:hypothetical protein
MIAVGRWGVAVRVAALGAGVLGAGAGASAQCAQWRWSTAEGVPGLSGGGVYALCGLADGSVVAGGTFTSAGGAPVRGLARLAPGAGGGGSGGAWADLGGGVDGPVLALAALGASRVAVGGLFSSVGAGAGLKPYGSAAVWDGAAWVSPGPVAGAVYALAVGPGSGGGGGTLYAGGGFVTAGSAPARTVNYVARLDGPAGAGGVWRPLECAGGPAGAAGGVAGGIGSVRALLPTLGAGAGGTVVCAGGFARANCAGSSLSAGVALWSQAADGASWAWAGLGGGVPSASAVQALARGPGGSVLAAVTPSSSADARFVWRWDGSAWTPVGTFFSATGSLGYVRTLATLPDGRVAAGGGFAGVDGVPAANLAVWDGAAWAAAAPGAALDGAVTALAVSPRGDLWVGGDFTRVAAGRPAAGVARLTRSPACPADFDCSGAADLADIFGFLAAWFAGDPRADFDGAGGVALPDIFAFLTAWFAGC